MMTIFVVCLLPAQNAAIPFRYFSLKEGLSDWTVTALQKDPSGLLWIGTAHGLQRFDGYKYLTFSTNPSSPYVISDHYVNSLKLFKDSLLVVSYSRNNELFDLIDYRNFKKNTVILKQSGITPSEQVQTIRVDEEGNVLVFTQYRAKGRKMISLYRFDVAKGRFYRISSLPSSFQGESSDQLFDALKVGREEWILSNNKDSQLILLNHRGILKKFQAQDFLGTKLPLEAFSQRVSILKRERSGQVWFAFAHVHHLFRYDSIQRVFRTVDGLPDDGEFSLWWQDKKGNVLVSKTSGNTRFPISKNLFCIPTRGSINDFSKFIRVSKQIIDVYSDDFFGTLFFGVDTGLKIFKNNQNIVHSYLQKDIDEDDFGRILRGMASDGKGNIFFANENSYWYRLNKKNGKDQIDTIRIIEERSDTVLRFNCCFALHYQSPHYLWGIACQGRDRGLLIRYNLTTQKATIYRYPARFRAFTADAKGLFWLLAEYPNGDYKLLNFNQDNAEFRTFYTAEEPSPLKNLFPYFIARGKGNTFWVTTNKGLYRIKTGTSPKSNQFETFKGRTGLGTQLIYCVYEDAEGMVWLGSSQGLIRFNPTTLSEKYYTEANGLASNVISGILEDHRGKLWISTHSGISCFDPKTEKFTNFYDLDGFSHSSFTRYSFFKDEENILYFGTINGVNAFRPERLTQWDSVPKVTLTRVSKYNWVQDTLMEFTQNLHQMRYLKLAADEQNLELEFTLPIYWDISKTKYRYKLIGVDEKWVDLEGRNQIKYNRLPPGAYELFIQGADPRGNWSKSLVLHLKVETFFYNTWWFWLLAALGIAIGGYFLVRSRLLQKLKIERLRTKISTDIHDEVSGLLAGIALQAEVMQHLGKDEFDKNRLQKIAEISRKAMSRLHDVIWSIDSRKDHLEDLLFRMQEHANDVLAPLNIQYQVQLRNLDLKMGIPIQIRQDLFFIFKEAINNVAKHAQAKVVHVRLVQQGRFFEMEIVDDGKPANEKKSGSGNGMQNMKMRAERIGGEITFVQNNGMTVALRMKRL